MTPAELRHQISVASAESRILKHLFRRPHTLVELGNHIAVKSSRRTRVLDDALTSLGSKGLISNIFEDPIRIL